MDQYLGKAKVRKERAQLSCAFCRHRKLKCDRNQPCEACVKRNQPCHYNTPAASRVSKPLPDEHGSTIKNRIQHLESLVLTLMKTESSGESNGNGTESNPSSSSRQASNSLSPPENKSSPPTSTNSQETEQAVKSFGLMNVNGQQSTKYIGNEHWAAILEDIEEVKNHFNNSAAPNGRDIARSESQYRGPDLLLGTSGAHSRASLLATLPPKPTMDPLIAAYINSSDPFCTLIHVPTFNKEYRNFWQNQYSAPLPWVSIIYSMMALTILGTVRAIDVNPNNEVEMLETVNLYRKQAANCLIESGYTRPSRYTIEALLIYVSTEYVRSPEIEVSLWATFSLIVRLAISMGYHRDASHYPNISVFDGEMRRRAWGGVAQLDILGSVQVGLPRMVRDDCADARTPHNYHDSDISEDMTELPPPRPDSEYTKMSYQIIKSRLTRVLGNIADAVNSTNSCTYEDVIQLDMQLLQAYRTMPEILKVKSMLASMADSPTLIMRRINIEIVFLKSRCILHRKYLTAFRTNSQYAYSREAGVSAATELLKQQAVLDSEVQMGGRLAHDKFLLSALTTGDFTLAAMIICLDLDSRTSHNTDPLDEGSDEALIELLQKSSDIWKEWSRQEITTPKANVASDALSIMLAKIKKLNAAKKAQKPKLAFAEQYVLPASVQQEQAEQYSNMTQSDQEQSPPNPNPELNAINSWMDMPQDIPWSQWDELFMPMSNAQDASVNMWPLDGSFQMENTAGSNQFGADTLFPAT